jgi:hypothetical protein
MAIRQIARRFGRELHCDRNIAHARVMQAMTMPQAIQALAVDERRALMQWLTRHGPFWEDNRVHAPDDYLECHETVVTDSALGEAAYCCFHGVERQLVSLVPSAWQFSPLAVRWTGGSGVEKTIGVINHWDPDDLEAALEAAPVPLASWEQLQTVATARNLNLRFSAHAFDNLLGHPFVPGAAQRVLILLDTLHRFRGCVDEHGQRTPEGQRLYQDHFTGDRAWFSDSSDTEKHTFRNELAFPHPTLEGQSLFCPWHGKISTNPLRIHFTWPVGADERLYVMYVGPKITKR